MDLHVDALNHALRNIPKEQTRLHVCYGNWQGPHQDDVPVDVLLPHLYRAEVGPSASRSATPGTRTSSRRSETCRCPTARCSCPA